MGVFSIAIDVQQRTTGRIVIPATVREWYIFDAYISTVYMKAQSLSSKGQIKRLNCSFDVKISPAYLIACPDVFHECIYLFASALHLIYHRTRGSRNSAIPVWYIYIYSPERRRYKRSV